MQRLSLILLLLAFACSASGQSDRQISETRDTAPNWLAVVSISPSSLDFRDQVVKTMSRPLRITVTNTGGKDLYVRSAALSEDEWQDFRITVDNCTGATIAPNRSCVVDIGFIPSATGSRRAILSLTDDAMDSPQKIKVLGNGINSVDVPPRSGTN